MASRVQTAINAAFPDCLIQEVTMETKNPPFPFAIEVAPGLAPFVAFQGPFTKALMRSSEVFAKSMRNVPTEVADFAGRRAQAHAKLYADCARCNDIHELIETHRKWWHDTGETYARQMNQLMAIGQTLINDATEAVYEVSQDGIAAVEKEMAASTADAAKGEKAPRELSAKAMRAMKADEDDDEPRAKSEYDHPLSARHVKPQNSAGNETGPNLRRAG